MASAPSRADLTLASTGASEEPAASTSSASATASTSKSPPPRQQTPPASSTAGSSSPLSVANTPSPTSTPPQRARVSPSASPKAAAASSTANGARGSSPRTSTTPAAGGSGGTPNRTARSQSPSSSPTSTTSSPSSSPNRGAANGVNNSRRVKLYVLRNDNWDDLGTGNCSTYVADPAMGVRPEEEGAWIFVQKEPQEGQKEGAVILRTKIPPYPPGYESDEEEEEDADGKAEGSESRGEDEGNFKRQQVTLIVWTDRATESDMALSFATAAGCQEIWNFIRKARRWTTDQLANSPTPSSPQSLSSHSQHSFPVYSAQLKLPEPSLGNIELIEHTLRALGRTVIGREKTANAIFQNDYIRKLIRIHDEAEDLESLEDLHALCRVMQTILLLNDSGLFELVLRDEFVLGVVGILEYDPEFPTMKASYKEHLSDTSHFTQVVPIKSTSLLAKIHQTHRLYYFKDVILARILEDSTFSILNSSIYFNEVEIVNEVATDPDLLKDLFAIFDQDDEPVKTASSNVSKEGKQSVAAGKSTPSASIGPQLPPDVARALGVTPSASKNDEDSLSIGPPAPPPADKKHDAILFLQQFASMAKNLQLALRGQLFRSLADRGLLRVIEVALSRTVAHEDSLMRSATIEILMALVDHDPSNVRGYSLKQQQMGKRPLVMFLIELFQKELDLGSKAQMAEALRVLVDAGGEGGPLEAPPRLRPEDPEAEKFLQYFYDHCIFALLAPLLELPTLAPSDPPLDMTPAKTALCTHLCDLLCFFVSHHTFRSKYFVLSSPIATSVIKLFRARQKHLRLAAIRFLRACSGRNDDFYNRFMIKNDLFSPVLDVAIGEKGFDNLLNSACLDFFENIRTSNQKAVLNHLMDRYGEKVRSLAPVVKTFANLATKWEQNNEPPPANNSAAANPAALTSKPMTREGSLARMDREEENYFDGSDEEDDKPSSTTTSKKREAGDSDGGRKRPRVDVGPHSAAPLPRSQSWPAGATKGKGLVDYGEDDEDTLGGFIREAAALEPEESLAQATAPSSGQQHDREPSGSDTTTPTPTTDTIASSPASETPPTPAAASPAEFKLRELKRKAEEDEDTMSLMAKGRKTSLSKSPGGNIKGPAAVKLGGLGAGGIKFAFGKTAALGSTKTAKDEVKKDGEGAS